MASYYWIKLYHEILDDPKMGRLSDHLWRRFFEFVLLAVEHNQDGRIPPINQAMAERLRSTTDQLYQDRSALTERDLIDHIMGATYKDGAWREIPRFWRFVGPTPSNWGAYGKDWTQIRLAILERDNHTCRYCGSSATHVDHIIPKCQKGTDADDNLVAACASCNLKKGGRTPEQAGISLLYDFSLTEMGR